MTRLIDAEKLKKHYAWWEDDERRTLFDQIVDAQPGVDAVPVTRCYECKYIYYEDGMEWKCTRTDTLIGGIEGYCAWAEPEGTAEVRRQLKEQEQRREMDRKK